MTVREFLEVVPFRLVDYAKIYEQQWNEEHEDYFDKFIGKRVHSQKDLEPYLEYKLSYFDYETQWGEYFDSAIYIEMPKGYKMNYYQKRKEQARNEAIAWRHNFEEYCKDYADRMKWGNYFYDLGKRYGLLREFRENGIC